MAHSPRRNFTRERIAHLAARLIAEDGIEDYALAKRKAARQAGAPQTRDLPSNDEIDAELRLYRELYQKDHPAHLRELRQLALEVMDEMAPFNPYLVGSVLTGSAGKYSSVHLQLFTDDSKAVEYYLLDRQIDFRASDTHFYAGGAPVSAPTYSYIRGGTEVALTVLTPRELRAQLKSSAEGKPIERAKRAVVEALIAE